MVFDPVKNLVFTSNGEGNMTVIKEDRNNKFSVVQTVSTKPTARTIALDVANQTLFLPSADIEPATPGATAGTRRKIIPGSFKVLVVKE